MITTCSHNGFPEIVWEIGDSLDYDAEERMETFVANGEDKAGNKYSGSAYFCCSEFLEINGIEKL